MTVPKVRIKLSAFCKDDIIIFICSVFHSATQAPLIILNSKSDVCMANNSKYTKHTRPIFRRINFVRNGEGFNMYKTVWCEGGTQLSDIGTKNVREDELNPRLRYTMVILDN